MMFLPKWVMAVGSMLIFQGVFSLNIHGAGKFTNEITIKFNKFSMDCIWLRITRICWAGQPKQYSILSISSVIHPQSLTVRP